MRTAPGVPTERPLCFSGVNAAPDSGAVPAGIGRGGAVLAALMVRR
ncbi:MAG: hypothetical protein BWX79_01942 [Alphaproteobacteria bacterium ADurb.Bin100]|nr:MAG: hypothetical protein BWX79_01942 [Alphaproteobacteria bacterium ADurb.Bin100]